MTVYTRGPEWGENYDATTLDGFNPFKAIGGLVKGAVKVAGSALGLSSGGTNEIKISLDDAGKAKLGIGPKAPANAFEAAQQAAAGVPTAVWVAGGVAAVALLLALTSRGGRR